MTNLTASATELATNSEVSDGRVREQKLWLKGTIVSETLRLITGIGGILKVRLPTCKINAMSET